MYRQRTSDALRPDQTHFQSVMLGGTGSNKKVLHAREKVPSGEGKGMGHGEFCEVEVGKLAHGRNN